MVAAPAAPLTMYLVGNENKTAANLVQRNEGEAINGPDLWDLSMAACGPYLKGSMLGILVQRDMIPNGTVIATTPDFVDKTYGTIGLMPSCRHDHRSDVPEAEPKNRGVFDVIRIDSSIKAQTVRGKTRCIGLAAGASCAERQVAETNFANLG